jgi:hypothetical protein
MSGFDIFDSPRMLLPSPAYPKSDWPYFLKIAANWADTDQSCPFPIECEYRLLSNLRSKLYGSGFNPAVFMAEGQKSVSMIGDAAFAVRLAVSSMIHRDWRGLAAALSVTPKRARKIIGDPRMTLSQKWLELQYGWKPLLKDVEDGAQWIAAHVWGGSQQQFPVLRASIKPVVFTRYKVPTASQYVWGTREIRYDLSLRVYAWTKSPDYMPSLATVGATLWEVLPYSFVADWFIPISSYLDALRTASDIHGVFVRSFKKTTTYSDPVFGSALYDRGYLYPFLPPKREDFEFTRTVTTEAKVPTPKLHQWNEILNLNRAANSVALLVAGKWFTKFQLRGLSKAGYTE